MRKSEPSSPDPASPCPRPGTRRGSIPLVLGITTVIIGLGMSSAMMTRGTRRTEKWSDLHQKALAISAAAAEETIVKLMNNSARWSEKDTKSGGSLVRKTFPPMATRLMYGRDGVIVDEVKVLARRLDAPRIDNAAKARFYGYLSVGPRFYDGSNPDRPERDPGEGAWKAQISDSRVKALIAPPDGVVPDAAAAAEMRASCRVQGDKVSQIAAESLKPIAKDAQGKDPAAPSEGALRIAVALQAIERQKVEDAEHVEVVCGVARPAAGQSSMLAGNALMMSVANGSFGFAQSDRINRKIVKAMLEGGAITKDTFLVTLESAATLQSAGLTVCAPSTLQRVVEVSDYERATRYAYGQMLAYLNHFYGLSYDDMLALKYVDGDGRVHPENIFPELDAKNPSKLNPQPWPFALAQRTSVR
jgi:hypothetical protein